MKKIKNRKERLTKKLTVESFDRSLFPIVKKSVLFSSKFGFNEIVPWSDNSEWKEVFDQVEQLHNSNVFRSESKEPLDQLLNRLRSWKAKISTLNVGIESSIILFEAFTIVVDENSSDIAKQSTVSNALMRFLNLICMANNELQGTFSRSAKSLGIPQDVIDARHEIAHSPDMPPLVLLAQHLSFCFDWIFDNYWLTTSTTIEHFVVNKQFLTDDDFAHFKNLLERFVQLYGSIVFYLFQNRNRKIELSCDIRNEKIITELRVQKLIKKDKNRKISIILKHLWLNIEHILNCYDFISNKKETFIEILLSNRHFLAIGAIRNKDENIGGDFTTTGSFERQHFDPDFVRGWKTFMKKLARNQMLNDFIVKCLEILNRTENGIETIQLTCALWLRECSSSLKFFLNLKRECFNALEHHKYNEWYHLLPLHNNNASVSDFNSFGAFVVPEIFKDFQLFSKMVLLEPNKYKLLFLDNFLDVFQNPIIEDKTKISIRNVFRDYLIPDDFFDCNQYEILNIAIDEKSIDFECRDEASTDTAMEIEQQAAVPNKKFTKCNISNIRNYTMANYDFSS